MHDYLDGLFDRFWNYQEHYFPDFHGKFSNLGRNDQGPPVFRPESGDCNVVAPRGLHEEVLRTIAASRRHRWFRSMRSSQALTQSVFGTLIVMDKLNLLSGVRTENGEPAFFGSAPDRDLCHLEHRCLSLGERKDRETQSDVYFDGALPVSVECKFSEDRFGECSQTQLKPDARNFAEDFCDGSYRMQAGRKERCSLSAKGIRYWQKIPMAFQWREEADHPVCPIAAPYQLVRNVLASGDGHALLVYDERNPAFRAEGECFLQWSEVHDNLLDRSRLRRCSWQRILKEMERDADLSEFVAELRDKYGF